MSKALTSVAIVALLALYFGLAVSAGLRKSVTFDELAHVTAGYSYWKTGDFRLHPENGNFPQRWAALLLLPGDFHFPGLTQPEWNISDVWELGAQFFYQTDNDPDTMLLRSRAMIALLGAGGGVLVYLWSRKLFGPAGGMISLCLYAFCPTTLAHGGLATSDMAAAVFFTAASWSLWRTLHRISPWTIIASSCSVAGLFLSKNSAVLFVPMALAQVFVRLMGRRPLEISFSRGGTVTSRTKQLVWITLLLVVHAAATWTLLWAAFGFRFSAFAPGRSAEAVLAHGGWDYVLEDAGAAGSALVFARDHRLLPEAYVYGLAFTKRFSRERPAFLNGQFSTQGWPWFFPYCLLAKTPVPVFLVLIAALLAACGRWRLDNREPLPRTHSLYDTLPLWILLGVYWAFSIQSHLDIGHRHILPTYLATYVLAGAAGAWLDNRASSRTHRWLGRLVVAALMLLAAETLAAWPNYLSYFNQLVGGPRRAYRHLVDSSLDWGQDLPDLAAWLKSDARARTDRVYLSYFGNGSPEHYGIVATRLPDYGRPGPIEAPTPWSAGTYCVSATMVQAVYLRASGPWTRRYEESYQELRRFLDELQQTKYNPAQRAELLNRSGRPSLPWMYHLFAQLRFARLCAYLRLREPDCQVNYTILIYRLTSVDLQRALDQPIPFEN